MCRLLGWVAPAPTTMRRLLGEDDLRAFTALSVKHGDGWGVATPLGDGVSVHRAAGPARCSPEFAGLARDAATDAALVHLRWATLGLPTTPDNAHPFTDGRMAFAHNGSITPPGALDDLIAADLVPRRRGDTDSERYFLVLLTVLRQHPDPRVALAVTVELVSTLTHSSLNAVLLTPDALHAVCAYTAAGEAEAEEDGYYRMGWTERDGTILVASSGWGEGWTDLRNGSLLTVSRATGAVQQAPLEDVAPHAPAVRPPRHRSRQPGAA